jgi:Secretion system C-terminal sorting domain
MGENIGFSTRLTQNNVQVVSQRLGPYISHLYYNASGQAQLGTFGERSVHIALMGDPTLKSQTMFIPRVTQMRATTEYPNKVNISWNGVPNVDGYVVYRVRATGLNRVTELTKMPITTTSFTDSLSYEGNVTYVVRACSLVTTLSGSYYEAGRQASVEVITTSVALEESEGGSVGGSVGVSVEVAPNPVSGEGAVLVSLLRDANVDVAITDLTGRVAAHWNAQNMSAGVLRFDINADEMQLTPGTYMVRVRAGAEVITQKLVVVSR